LEAYYQETGRAGRDGLRSDCVLFYSYGDRQKIEYFINQMTNEKERQIAHNKLYDIIHFCETGECRRKLLLDYFGEEYKQEKCSSCDNCLIPKDEMEATGETRAILSCVEELGEMFGINYCIDVLTASKSSRIQNNGHASLRSYGSGKNLPKRTWHTFIRELLRRGYLRLEGEYPVLKLCHKSRDMLLSAAGEKIFLVKPAEVKKTIAKEYGSEDGELFEALRVLRKTLADAENYPPYMIFNDASLKQMALWRPCTQADFRKITGVGDKKLKKYSAIFTGEIRRFCEKHNSCGQPAKKRPSEHVTLEMLNQNMNLDEITLKRNLSLNTIYAHIEKLIFSGENIPIETFIKKDKIDAISKAILELGGENPKPIREKLGDGFSYGEIKLVRAGMYMRDTAPSQVKFMIHDIK
ncbi:MAG TPA: RQC domain-containing protein, partial [Candidatus Methanoperedens sp.]